ncbi:hypothetical protein BGZ96_010764, partial [Linnemannia gamsii]
MKIAHLSLGLVVVAVVAAQVGDPLAASGAQPTYQWAQQGGEQNDLVYQLEEIYSQISELEYRAQFLSRPDQRADIMAAATSNKGELDAEATCSAGSKMIQTALQEVVKAISNVQLPGFMPIQTFLQKDVSDVASKGGSSSASGTIMAIDSVLTMLKVISTASSGLFPPTITQELNNIKEGLSNLLMCSASVSVASIEQASCYEIADLYRAIVADVLANAPAIPADASEDLQRYSAGTQAILQIISKNSIAANNDALLNSRPVFAAELLDTYRTEMVRAGAKDAVQSYAATSLSLVIGSSNALEACLRIAANPAAAVEDLNDELDALEDEDEEYEDDEPEAADAAPQADDAAPQ